MYEIDNRKITSDDSVEIASSLIKVGDIIKLTRGKRVPADMILIYTP